MPNDGQKKVRNIAGNGRGSVETIRVTVALEDRCGPLLNWRPGGAYIGRMGSLKQLADALELCGAQGAFTELWEFPCGKLRELREELGIEVLESAPFGRFTHDYNDRVVLDVWVVNRSAHECALIPYPNRISRL